MWATFSMPRPSRSRIRRSPTSFCASAILRDVLDAKLARSQIDAHRDASRDDHGNQPGRAQKVDAETVLNVVALELVAGSGNVTEVDATVGEHAVDVESDDTNGAGDRRVDHWRHRCQRSTARLTSVSSDGQRQHVRAVARGVIGIGVRLEKEAVGTGRDRGPR